MKIKINLDRGSQARVERFIRNHPRAFSYAVKIGLMRIGGDIRNEAGTNAPYKSGTLRRSLTNKTHADAIFEHKSNGKKQSVAVGSNLVYARIQELGGKTGRGGKGGKGLRGATSITGKKFLTRPFEVMRKGEGQKILDQEIESAIARISKRS